eukprot:scaffold61055_cov17-Tisochrysis_lutea.AAC.2
MAGCAFGHMCAATACLLILILTQWLAVHLMELILVILSCTTPLRAYFCLVLPPWPELHHIMGRCPVFFVVLIPAPSHCVQVFLTTGGTDVKVYTVGPSTGKKVLPKIVNCKKALKEACNGFEIVAREAPFYTCPGISCDQAPP